MSESKKNISEYKGSLYKERNPHNLIGPNRTLIK